MRAFHCILAMHIMYIILIILQKVKMDTKWILTGFNYSRLFLLSNKTYIQMPFSLDKQLLIAAASFGKRTQALLWATINERLSLRPSLLGPTDKCMGKKAPLIAIKNLWRSYF